MSTPSASLYKRATLLTAVLFAGFVAITLLYARSGYPFVLWVFEKQQLATSLNSEGKPRPAVYRDYLRVDPANLRMRGIFINELIRVNGVEEAFLVAQEGVAAVPPDQRPIAKLLVARAQTALGKLDEAESTYNDVLETLGESGEAHYGLAQIAAAMGDFESKKRHFDWYFSLTFLPNSNIDVGPDTFSIEPKSLQSPNSTIDFNQRLHMDPWLYLPVMDDALDWPEAGTSPQPNELFWRGVYEEEQGNRDAALDFYRRAAKSGNALGRFAALRLNTPPVPPQQ